MRLVSQGIRPGHSVKIVLFPAKCLLIVHWNVHICVGSRLDNGEAPAGGQGP